MNDLNALLSTSIQHYEDILALFATINHDKGSYDPATLHAKSMELLALQKEIANGDETLVAAMNNISPDAPDQPVDYSLIEKRKELMRQIYIHNRSLLSTIQNIQSLLTHEIKEMQDGRTALNGYRRTSSTRHGSILNDARG